VSFYTIIETFTKHPITDYCESITGPQIESILSKDRLSEIDYYALLSEKATPYLEHMAQKAKMLTQRHFGNVVFIFTPLYVSNYCDNVCAYCSFARQYPVLRRHLSHDEIREEAEHISSQGIRHILILTGESRSKAPPEYLEECIRILSDYFSSISIEVYPLATDEYRKLILQGVDGLTIYQETYNETLYKRLHSGGPKGDYRFRLDTPERACKAGIRAVTVGALLGLHDFRSEAFLSGLHAAYLQKQYPSVEVSVSFPRLRPLQGDFQPDYEITDKQFVQMMTALRLFLPTAGITVSTRESQTFRNAIVPLGVTKMSAGVTTAVGGHSKDPSTTQFEIADNRSVEQVRSDLLSLGYQPVMHDWDTRYVKSGGD